MEKQLACNTVGQQQRKTSNMRASVRVCVRVKVCVCVCVCLRVCACVDEYKVNDQFCYYNYISGSERRRLLRWVDGLSTHDVPRQWTLN